MELVNIGERQVFGRHLRQDAGPKNVESVPVNTQSSKNATMCEVDMVCQSSLAAVKNALLRVFPIEVGGNN